MRISDEKGIALVLSIFLMTAMSIIAASLMFLSQTETYSSLNYRLMSQARYGAESGVHKAANYLLYTTTYVAPGNTGAAAGDNLASYDVTKSPVQYNGAAVVLSADTVAHPANYPVAAVQTAFAAAFSGTLGTLPAGTTTVSFAPYAILVSMQQVEVYGVGVQTIQTWQVASTGTITAGRTAQVEVTAIIETPKFPATMYAAFGTASTCGALNFNGNNTQTDSYDSSAALVAGSPYISLSGGSVGTNGNLSEGGGADIYGSLSSPRVGVGNCSNGNVDALSSSGGATINNHDASHLEPGDVLQLPAAVQLQTPTFDATGVSTNNVNINSDTLWDTSRTGDNITVAANKTLTLGAVGTTTTITVNSIKLVGNASLVILGTVILNVVGTGATTPIDFTGGSVANSNTTIDPVTLTTVQSYNAAQFQIQYKGTDEIKLNGGAKTTAMVYAPNAANSLNGGGNFYGSVVGATVKDTGGAHIHYDRHLSSEFFTVGNAMMSSFSWKKY